MYVLAAPIVSGTKLPRFIDSWSHRSKDNGSPLWSIQKDAFNDRKTYCRADILDLPKIPDAPLPTISTDILLPSTSPHREDL